MTTFYLPDLGEGLPDAEIVEWHVSVGDQIKVDDPLVSMETAKAIVEVPSPQAGTIKKLHGSAGDVVQTGKPLVDFETTETASPTQEKSSNTVAGKIEEGSAVIADSAIVLEGSEVAQAVRAAPTVRMLARQLGIDLARVKGTGPEGAVLRKDISPFEQIAKNVQNEPPEGFEALKGTRRRMAQTMAVSHAQVVPVTLYDDADVTTWIGKDDITTRLIQAVVAACQQEPALNAWFDGQHMARQCHDTVHLGLAVDGADGLFVPVISSAEQYDTQQLREKINNLKTQIHERSLPPESLTGATITLSNFGKYAGRYASPIVVPPMVAIIGVGRLLTEPAVIEGEVMVRQKLPLSLTFDHRAATGGEATRFMGAMLEALST